MVTVKLYGMGTIWQRLRCAWHGVDVNTVLCMVARGVPCDVVFVSLGNVTVEVYCAA